MAFSRPFKEDRLALPLSTSSRRSTVWWPWFCAHRWCSQAPQHFRSSETQVTFDGCFAHNENVKGSTSSGCFESGCPTMTHANLGFLFHFSLFATSSFNMLGWWNVWSDSHLLRQSNWGNVWLFSLPLSSWRWDRISCTFPWMVVVPCLTVKSHVSSLVTESSVYIYTMSHQCRYTLWDPAVCYFLEWKSLSLNVCCQLAILDTTFPSFLAGVSLRGSGIGFGPFLTPWFAWAVTVPVCILCLSRFVE